jgi:hypothetical protein
MVALKSAARRTDDPALTAQLQRMKSELPEWHRGDFADLIRHFRLNGMTAALLN